MSNEKRGGLAVRPSRLQEWTVGLGWASTSAASRASSTTSTGKVDVVAERCAPALVIS